MHLSITAIEVTVVIYILTQTFHREVSKVYEHYA